MASCPVCQTENEADFGLVNCRSCGSPFFVEIDGSASSSEIPSAPEIPKDPTSPSIKAADIIPTELPPLPEMPIQDGLQALDSFDTPAAQEVPLPPPPAPPMEDLREIASYGNSEVSQAREGAYRFSIIIRGIDTAEIRQSVRHELADSRFLWDIDALLDTVTNGELVIDDVSAVKAALAIQRLKLLPVEIRWEQHAIHQNH